MARSTGGRSSGGRSSGGHSSGARSSGGHRVSRSSSSGSSARRSMGGSSFGSRPSSRPSSRPGGFRPGMGGGSSGFGTGFGLGYAAGQHNSGHSGKRPSYGYSRPGSGSSSSGRPGGGSGILPIIVVIIVIVVIIGLFAFASGGDIPDSTANREKLTGTGSYDSNCVVDAIGWLNNDTKAAEDLKTFYKLTGVQPFVVFNEYDDSLTTDSKKDSFAENWYEKNIDNENTFVFMYFGTEHEGDGEPGYMCYVMGDRVDSVMDSEAVEIFWAFLDKNWYDETLTENQVIVNTFNETAERIMTKTKTSADVLIWMIIAVIIIGALLLILRIRKQKRQHEAEKAKETEAILNTPLEKIDDELLEQYYKEDDNKTQT